jgi:hypothetical protein
LWSKGKFIYHLFSHYSTPSERVTIAGVGWTEGELGASFAGVLTPPNLDVDLNWKSFHGEFLGFTSGINLQHVQGHTPGLTMMQINFRKSRPWLLLPTSITCIRIMNLIYPRAGWLESTLTGFGRTRWWRKLWKLPLQNCYLVLIRK